MITDTSNINFQLATDFINYTNRSVFLTGKAGTGKTTFLKYIRKHCIKQMAVVAPTGVAAINAGGVTIHSFFQLPFGPFIPEGSANNYNGIGAVDKHNLIGRLKISSDRRKIFQQLELLIIDEISMVRADVLDAIDTVLKHFRNRHQEPFGGIQLLFIGDMFQLPPVAKDEEWKILGQYYSSPYFFSSKVLVEQEPAYIELNKIYRQTDERFINVLNSVRNNDLDEDGYEILHKQYNPNFQPNKEAGYITLTTHNSKADAINGEEIEKVATPFHFFNAEIKQDFSEKSYPAEEVLKLKVGAQVMFIKNDLDKAKRYFNGKIGVIEKIETDKILVQCKGEAEAIEVKKYLWENIRYTLNKQSQKVEEEVVGSFTQYPLRLAWAITIHKSQGLTFEKAVVDAGRAFAPGQVYVALSRCTNLEGVVLLSRITPSSLHSDDRILEFSNNQHAAQLPNTLQNEKQYYQSKLVLNIFDFNNAVQLCSKWARVVRENKGAFNTQAASFVMDIQTKLQGLQQVAKKFEIELQHLLQHQSLPEKNEPLQIRFKKAAHYFYNELHFLLDEIKKSTVITDSRQYAMAYNEDVRDLFENLALQHHLLQICLNGFNVDDYHSGKNNFQLPHFSVNAYAKNTVSIKTNSPHPNLYLQLKKLRDSICDKTNLALYMVASGTTIDEMATFLPLTLTDLKKITGFGDAKVDKYGLQFLDIIVRYCNEHDLTTLIQQKSPKKEKKEKSTTSKIASKDESLALFKQGKTVAEIAAERNVTVQTIEGHLAYFIATGEINVTELLSKEKVNLISPFLKNFEGGSIVPIKEKLGNAVSFGDIKLVLAWKEFEDKQKVETS